MFNSNMFLPHSMLLQWIKVYWIIEGKGLGKNEIKQNILPDGTTTILFILEGSLKLSTFKNGNLNRGIYIIPPVLNSHYDLLSDNLFIIDIHLNPSIFNKLFHLPINILENKAYTFDDLSINFDKSILDKLLIVKNNKLLIYNELNNFFLKLFNQKNFYSNDIVLNIQALYQDGNLDKFFSEQNLSIRQLERKVKEYTGLTPKGLSRIGRFYSILQYMKFRQFDINLSQVAFEHKFSDQSHFIKEFKQFSETTPTNFLDNTKDYLQFQGLCNLTKIMD